VLASDFVSCLVLAITIIVAFLALTTPAMGLANLIHKLPAEISWSSDSHVADPSGLILVTDIFRSL